MIILMLYIQRNLRLKHTVYRFSKNVLKYLDLHLEFDEVGRGPDMTLVHPPPHILANLYFFEPLGCPEYEIGL